MGKIGKNFRSEIYNYLIHEGRRQKFSCSEGVLTPLEPRFFLKEEVLNQSGKEEVDLNLLPSALCPLPLRAKPDRHK